MSKQVAISDVRVGQRVMHDGMARVVQAKLYRGNVVILRFKHTWGVTEIRKNSTSLVEVVRRRLI